MWLIPPKIYWPKRLGQDCSLKQFSQVIITKDWSQTALIVIMVSFQNRIISQKAINEFQHSASASNQFTFEIWNSGHFYIWYARCFKLCDVRDVESIKIQNLQRQGIQNFFARLFFKLSFLISKKHLEINFYPEFSPLYLEWV